MTKFNIPDGTNVVFTNEHAQKYLGMEGGTNRSVVWDHNKESLNNHWKVHKHPSQDDIYMFKHLERWQYLQIEGGTNHAVTWSGGNEDESTWWTIKEAGSGRFGPNRYYLNCHTKKAYLQKEEGTQYGVVWPSDGSASVWKIEAVSKLTGVQSVTITFDENEIARQMSNVRPELVAHQELQYLGVPYEDHPSISYTVRHLSSLSFTEGIEVSFSDTVTAGIEGIGDVSETLGISASLSSTQSHGAEFENTIANTIDVSVVDKTLYAIMVMKKATINLKFTMTVIYDDGKRYETHGVWNGICFGDAIVGVNDKLSTKDMKDIKHVPVK